MKNYYLLLATMFVLFFSQSVSAQSGNVRIAQTNASQTIQQVPASQINPADAVSSGDTAWMLVSTALVMLMTPGLALFYGGMVRRKNVLGTIMQSFVAIGIITVQWILFGYSLAFGPDVGHVIGSLKWLGLNGVGLTPDPDYAPTIPHQTYMMFQMMFAVITPALITGAFAERFKFKTYIVFLLLWATLVYDPLAHWVWGMGGWIKNLGGLDFAGGLVVHVSSGVSALAAAIIIGKRRAYGQEPMPPHNMTMTLLGAALLWFGWFGFNAGSAVASGALATSAFVATHVAAASAALSWMFSEWVTRGKPTVLGAASGAVAGLVAITPASGFVSPLAALVIGMIGGIVCFCGIRLKDKFRYDDSLDTVGVHGIGGSWGAIATGLFATKLINPAGGDGLFYGNLSLLGVQLLCVIVAVAYAFAVSWVILKILDKTMGLRVFGDDEIEGLDLSQHGESGYVFEEL
ncbi:MAG TPA: ammonium transporter [Candidatus Acidoferrales bacterium]|nr:ammonium transporter [Candidatus Acidoferrales bacterium]